MKRTLLLLGLLAVLALCLTAASAIDFKIWISAAGAPAPTTGEFASYVWDYQTTSFSDAMDQTRTYYTDWGGYGNTIEWVADDGVYEHQDLQTHWNVEDYSTGNAFFMMHNVTVRSKSNDPTACVLDWMNPLGQAIPGYLDSSDGATSVIEIISCWNFKFQGLTIRGNTWLDTVYPGLGERYSRKLAYYKAEINADGTYSLYAPDGTYNPANLQPLGYIPIFENIPMGTRLSATDPLIKDKLELPPPAGLGLGGNRPDSPGTEAYVEVVSGNPGDWCWWHGHGSPNVSQGFDNTNGWVGPFQQVGTVGLRMHTGYWGVGMGGSGRLIQLTTNWATGGTDPENGLRWVDWGCSKGTFENCILRDSREGPNIDSAYNYGGPPAERFAGTAEKSKITFLNCDISDIQSWNNISCTVSNVDFIGCTMDLHGGHYGYSKTSDTPSRLDMSQGTVALSGVPNTDGRAIYGPFKVNVLDSTISRTELMDIWWLNAGIAVLDWDYWGGGGDAAWDQGGFDLTVNNCTFKDNRFDMILWDFLGTSASPVKKTVLWTNNKSTNCYDTALWCHIDGTELLFENCSIVTTNKPNLFAYVNNIRTNGYGISPGARQTISMYKQYYNNLYLDGHAYTFSGRGNLYADFTNITVFESAGSSWGMGGGATEEVKMDNFWSINSGGGGLDSNAPNGIYNCSRVLVSGSSWNGISCWAGTWNFDQCTVSGCDVPNWGDGFATGTCTVNIKNSISVFNSECGVACWGSGPTTVSYSNVFGNATLQAAYDAGYGDYYNVIDGGNNMSADPMFVGRDPVPAPLPGGRMENWLMVPGVWQYELDPASPCIGAGDMGQDLGAIQYGTHELTATYDLLPGWNWFTVPVCPYDKDMATVMAGNTGNLSKWDTLTANTQLYGDFTYWLPGEAYVVWSAGQTLSVPSVPLRADCDVPVVAAGRRDFGVPFNTPYKIGDILLRKYTNTAAANVPPVWALVEERSMAQDYAKPAGEAWFNWQIVWWDAANSTAVADNVDPSYMLEPWRGYRLWTEATAIAQPEPGWLHEKIDLHFDMESYGPN